MANDSCRDLSTAFGTSFPVSFFVQCIYAHRVWIIGHQNKLLTGAVVVAALVQLVFGFALFGVARHADNITTLFDSPVCHESFGAGTSYIAWAYGTVQPS
ncbi:hypothetical protein F5141DRAFT_1095610 [Pisolithus sp. B1]|nr:hypothetical protein F5141DRAFT_1095610 [Pisolithus sp. B1]